MFRKKLSAHEKHLRRDAILMINRFNLNINQMKKFTLLHLIYN